MRFLNIFRNPNLLTRLLVWFVLVGLLPLTLVAYLSYNTAAQALQHEVETGLASVADSKANQIGTYATERLKDVIVLARQPAIADALEQFSAAFQGGGIDSAAYQDAEAKYKDYLTDFAGEYGYEDLYLLSSTGDTVFSLARGEDLGSNFYTGIYKDTGLAHVFEGSQTLLEADISEFAYYPPTNEPAAFIGAPVMKDNQLIGALVLEINKTELYGIVNDYTGLDRSGETVIGQQTGDKIYYMTPMRHDPYAAFRRSIQVGSDTGHTVQESVLGLQGSGVEPDYRGQEVIANWRYLPELRWGMVVKIDTEEAFAPIVAQRNQAITLGIASLLGVLLVAILVARSISGPVVNLTNVANQIASGDVDAVAKVETTDEIGTLAQAFNAMNAQVRELITTLEERVAERTKAIATSSAVSRRLSTILNRRELVIEVVEQVKNAFGYYHAHIYLVEGDELVMAGGTGDAGASMLADGHSVPKGRGLVGRAADTNEPVLVSFTAQDPDWLPNPLLPDTKSELALPISIGDLVLGVLDVQHDVAGGLDQEDVDSLNSIANQVAIAMQNIESAETVAKRAKELETVAEISTATATIQDTFQMLESMVHLTQRGFGLYHAHVFTYHDDTKELKIVACGYREGDENEGTHGTAAIALEAEQSLVARAGRTRQPVIVNDVRNEPGWLPNPLLPDTRAELAVPMIVGTQLLGVLDVQSERLDAFTEEDANIQMTLASQVATALQNAQSFSTAQHQAEHETKLNLITQRIQAADTIEGALKIAARELGLALGNHQTMVSLDPAALAGESKVVANE